MFAHTHNLRRRQLLITGTVLLIIAALTALFLFRKETLPPPINPLYRNAELDTEERIQDLIRHMTLEEKVGQMILVEKNSVHAVDDVTTFGIGAVLSGAGGKPEENTLSGWLNMVKGFDTASRASRLGIPVLYGVDANHGHSNVPGATIFPHSIGLGATQDEVLVEKVARATREELLATGIYWTYSPMLDLPEDIRWGRVYESFSDDPNLTARLGAAYIQGLQQVEDGTSEIAVLATPKHYIGGGAMRWDTSSNENFSIDQGTTPPNDEKLRQVYLPPFERAVDTGAKSIMVGLNSWGDVKLSANTYLIQDVLKDELGFDGFVVSDWYSVYEIPGGKYKAAVTAINAGVDMVMLPFDYKTFVKNIKRAVERGDIKEARIDDAVFRILRAKFDLGLFERKVGTVNKDLFGSKEHRTLARKAVAQSLVLLKNKSALLPVKKSVDHIRIAGSAADNSGKQMGAWTVEWQGIDGNWLSGATSILTGIRERAGEDVDVEFEMQGNFPEHVPKADIGIAIVGESPYAEGWGDTAHPSLSAEDTVAISRLREASEKVVVILVTGRPLMITEMLDAWDTLVVAWLPGSEGGGVADVLFGKSPFVGKLPLPWPSHSTQLPINVAGVTSDGTEVLFPRYFGLRY